MSDDVLKKMVALATKAYEQAYAPYSQFRVGACIRAQNDELFVGCNVENASYSLTLCAESTAIGAMISAGCQKIKEVVIVVPVKTLCPPCGACRNRIAELADGNIPVHLYNAAGEHQTLSINEFYPHPFGSFNLENKK